VQHKTLVFTLIHFASRHKSRHNCDVAQRVRPIPRSMKCFYLMCQLDACTVLHTTLWSLYSNMFRHDNAIFREYAHQVSSSSSSSSGATTSLFESLDSLNYTVVQIWPGQTVTCLHTNSPGHIWTTLYFFPCNSVLDAFCPIFYHIFLLFVIRYSWPNQLSLWDLM
jgi:hypothetical protein